MRDLNYALKQLGVRNRDGSYATQATRARTLRLIADQLIALGYTTLHATELKGRHVNALLRLWQAQELASGTLKNRLAAVRWWAEKVGRAWVLARANAHYGIPERQYVAQTSKACTVGVEALAQIRDPYVQLSLELQRAFGLRREEAIKFRPRSADHGDTVQLKASWTKGGKPRTIPLRTAAHREVLDRAHALAGPGSLIPPQRSYIQQVKCYERQTAQAGLSKLHGLRHAYAQERYQELTGWAAPTAGGPPRQQLTPAQRRLDYAARLQVSRELGHEREAITVVYLGR